MCDGLQDTRPGLWSNLVSAVAQVALSVVLVHPRLGGLGYLGMAAARSCGGAVCLLLMLVLIRRAKLQHLVWRLPPSPPPPPSPPSPPSAMKMAGTVCGPMRHW